MDRIGVENPMTALLEREQPDAILCVHVFTGMMMTELRRNYGVTIPTWFVATDYTCSPGTGDMDMDGFCIPHADLADEFVGCGCDREKLIPTGIPVRQAFRNNMSQADARKALGLTDARRIFLLLRTQLGITAKLHFVQHARLGGRRSCVLTLGDQDSQTLLIALHMMERDEDGHISLKRTAPRHPMTRQCCRRAFLRGAFLGCGSVTNPDRSYHFEWVAEDQSLRQTLAKLLDIAAYLIDIQCRIGIFPLLGRGFLFPNVGKVVQIAEKRDVHTIAGTHNSRCPFFGRGVQPKR